jgi:hypothetical protein
MSGRPREIPLVCVESINLNLTTSVRSNRSNLDYYTLASMNQNTSTANSAIDIPRKYEMATSFPIFTPLLLLLKHRGQQCRKL